MSNVVAFPDIEGDPLPEQEGFVLFPSAFWRYLRVLGLKPVDGVVVGDVLAHSSGSVLPWPSIKEICEHTGIDRSTIYRSVSRMESESLLEMIPSKGHDLWMFEGLFCCVDALSSLRHKEGGWKCDRRRGFLSVPSKAFSRFRDLGVTPHEFAVLCAIQSHSGWRSEEKPFVSVSKVAEYTYCTSRAVNMTVGSLASRGLLERTYGQGKKVFWDLSGWENLVEAMPPV